MAAQLVASRAVLCSRGSYCVRWILPTASPCHFGNFSDTYVGLGSLNVVTFHRTCLCYLDQRSRPFRYDCDLAIPGSHPRVVEPCSWPVPWRIADTSRDTSTCQAAREHPTSVAAVQDSDSAFAPCSTSCHSETRFRDVKRCMQSASVIVNGAVER
jgi:hypothetical protein